MTLIKYATGRHIQSQQIESANRLPLTLILANRNFFKQETDIDMLEADLVSNKHL